MAKKYLLILGLLLASGGLFFWRSHIIEKQPQAVRRHYTTMGTLLEFIVYPQTEHTDEAIGEAFREIERLNEDYSTFREDSLVSQLSRRAPENVEVSDEFIYILERNREIYQQTEKQFDPTVGPLIELWGFYRHEGNVPSDTEIDRARGKVGLKKISQENSKVALQEEMRLDFGASVKGYAVDRAREILRQRGESNFLINLGGNIYASGSPATAEQWRIGLRDPRNENKIIASIGIKNEAVATSGDYERMFEINGVRHAHIINPLTGRPVKSTAAVTVIAADGLTADLYSTAIYLTGKSDYLKTAPVEGFLLAEIEEETLNYILSENFKTRVLSSEGKLQEIF